MKYIKSLPEPDELTADYPISEENKTNRIKRLKEIKSNGGVEAEHKKIAHIAEIFRNSITGLPLEIFSESKSNAVTALRVKSGNAKEIISKLKDEYGIWICPNGGEIGNTVFRVGHIGFISDEDVKKLSTALSRVMQDSVIGLN